MTMERSTPTRSIPVSRSRITAALALASASAAGRLAPALCLVALLVLLLATAAMPAIAAWNVAPRSGDLSDGILASQLFLDYLQTVIAKH